MIANYIPENGRELSNGGTAADDRACVMCRRRFERMIYIVGRWQCMECTAKSHLEAAREGRI